MARLSAYERILQRIEVDPVTGCWIWPGAKQSRGYGSIRDNGPTRQCHHVTWEHANGRPFPKGMMGCHKCDTPACCNPDHIVVADQDFNMKEMMERGRGKGQFTSLYNDDDDCPF